MDLKSPYKSLQDLNSLNKMFKYLCTVFLIFIQFFLKDKNEENIDLYFIFLDILINIGLKTKLKNKNIYYNIECICYDNMLIISYLCLKNEKNEFKNIFDNIIEFTKMKEEKNDPSYINIGDINYEISNPFLRILN